jgi:phosphatidylinositol kinase/protein kinase (PI-3  family)
MNTLKRFLPGCLGLAVCLTALVSCGPGNPGSWKNEQIKPSLRTDFHQRNDEVFGLLKQDDAEKLKSYESADMVDNAETLRQVERISNHLKKDDYVLLDEYYVVHKQKGENKIVSNRNDVGNYNFG